jgi:UDP-glucose 4-epimerase
MRVLVTGSAGFIGSHITDHLLLSGHEVAAVDDLSRGKRENVSQGVRFYKTDIRTGCDEVFEEFRPDALCHQAAQVDVRRSLREPHLDAEINVLGTIRMLENCVAYNLCKIVFASSGGAVYGEQRSFPATEAHPQYPISPYGVSKLVGEHYLRLYNICYNISCVALRYANVYGPRQDPYGEGGVVAIFSRNLAAGRRSTINGTGEQTRDYIYVDDVARANVLALEREVPSGAYNIGTGIETSVNRLYEVMQESCGSYLPPEHGLVKPGEQIRSSVDPSAAGGVLGWRPEIELVTGLKRTLHSFRVSTDSEKNKP